MDWRSSSRERISNIEAVNVKYVAAGREEKATGFAASLLLLTKPGIVVASALTGLTGMVMAMRGLPDTTTTLACMVSLVSAATGSAMLNILFEAVADARLMRLEQRTAALQKVSKLGALMLAGILIALGLIVSLLCLNPRAYLLILAAIVFYTLIYTIWLKRSPWGAVPGALTGALPVLIGIAATGRPIGPDGMILFAVMLLWQPPHFWSLAIHFQKDYENAGIPILPTVLGVNRTKALILLGNASLIPTSLLLWSLGYCSSAFAFAALLSGVGLLVGCYLFIIKSDRFALAFRCSIIYLIVLLLAIISDICLVQGLISGGNI